MTTIAIVYRNNELFAKYVPFVIKTLKDGGCEVESLAFPASTTVEVMRETIKRNPTIMAADRFLNDRTCNAFLFMKRALCRDWASGKALTLDSYLHQATIMAVQGRKVWEWRKESEEAAKGFLKRLVTEALVCGASEPEEILVATSSLLDHLKRLDRAEWVTDQFNEQSVANWFQELFPNAKVRLQTSAEPPKPHVWVVVDRHHVQEETLRRWREENPEMGLVFRLPMETAAQDLAIRDLLSIDEALLRDELRKRLQKDLSAVASTFGAG